ncbi:MAG: OsmC family protein [Bacteroidales bacterium]|nr:OsmC family protein [Bacteroidales bacterium]
MAESVEIKLNGEMSFEVNLDGHKFEIDAVEQFGGADKGPRPKNLMLASIAGCTGMDVVSILKKMKVVFDDFTVVVTGTITEVYPKHFDTMHIVYRLKGKEIPREKVEKAVILSQDKYCGVTYSFKPTVNITHEIIIEDL